MPGYDCTRNRTSHGQPSGAEKSTSGRDIHILGHIRRDTAGEVEDANRHAIGRLSQRVYRRTRHLVVVMMRCLLVPQTAGKIVR